MTLGIVTGLPFEAELLRAAARDTRSPPPLIVSAGLGPGRARQAAENLLRQGALRLLSFGLAAGLDPALQVGDVVAATEVRSPTGTPIPCDSAWASRLAHLPNVRTGLVATVPNILDLAGKAHVRGNSGCAVADMESYEVAEAAQAAGVPFTALRAISDGASQDVPPAALVAMDSDGRLRLGAVLASILRRPGQIGDLIRLGRSTARARDRLRALADLRLARGFFGNAGDE